MSDADERYQAMIARVRDEIDDGLWFDLDNVVGERLSEAAGMGRAELVMLEDERNWLRDLVDRLTT